MDETIYLDNAATSFPKPDKVHEATRSFYREYGVNPGRTGCDLSINAERMINDTRRKYSDFFNQSLVGTDRRKNPDRLVFTLNATMGLNLIINGATKPGDHIITTILEHNSVIRPVNHRVKAGAEATFVKTDPEGYLDPEDIRKAIKPNTKLVIVNHGSNVSGVVQDLLPIGDICKEKGIQFAVDVAQTAGVIPIDMAECNISFLAFTGHKGLFGPTGTGGICVGDDAEIEGTIYGGTGVRSAELYHLDEFPYRLEAGTLNLAGIAGLSAGLDWILGKRLNKIYRHEIGLFEKLQTGLSEIKGVKLWGTTNLEKRCATLSASVEGYDPEDIGTILDVEFGIMTRTGLHCAPLIHEFYGSAPRGTVRFSLGPFNTENDIDVTLKAVTEIAADRQ
ncbi:MAG: aminotransferase class V-fold PLP-dependent enzyme [bacterium]|nr:aminotransferase class V-fold PLP-dependent enzyme [bacterium]